MNNPFRRSSQSSDDDPFDVPENYYGSTTNPAKASKDLKFGRIRTFSVFEAKTTRLNTLMSPLMSTESVDDASNQGSSTSLATSPTPEVEDGHVPPSAQVDSLRRGSIVPIYHDVTSTDSLGGTTKPVEIQAPRPISQRRASLDLSILAPKKFYINDIDMTLKELLQNEDTDHNFQITIEDSGPKVLNLGTANSNGYNQFAVRGTYQLLNLLQELTIAKRFGRNQMILDEQRLCENPVRRMKRLITTQFWRALTRKITRENIVEMARDTKIVEEYINEKGELVKNAESVRLYIPHDRPDQYEYFSSIKKENPEITLDVQYLPEKIDAAFIKSINKKPGLLALEAKPGPDGDLQNEPYVVPGGRFNELYGWDSYMIVLGLLLDATPEDQKNLQLSRGMTENFIYEIKHYNKILNANRSYYLGRSQPPFLTDMALRVFEKTLELNPNSQDDALDFLKRSTLAAIKEYDTVWVCKPRLDERTGLSCYHPDGEGIPPETEASHFNAILAPYLKKHNVTQPEFIEMYNAKQVHEPDLDEYFLHDRAVRESGHDTSYRLEGKAAYLATVDLNSLIYKYEVDIASIIEKHFGGELFDPRTGHTNTPAEWRKKAELRQKRMTEHLWNEEDSIFYDYHIKEQKQSKYESATCFWPLYAGAATEDQADKLVRDSLRKFEEDGGLVSGTLRSRGEVSILRPSRQWDYPYGWAPQQMLAWIGLTNYNYNGAARRLAYRWLYMMTRAFVDYNGVVVEKYNVLSGAVPHRVNAEYGNQGADFKGVATEGFGWVNASYLVGLTYLNLQAQRSLGALIPPDVFLKNMNESQKELYT